MARISDPSRFRRKPQSWRSGLEASVAAQLRAAGIDHAYEKLVLVWRPPAKDRKYTPDFVITTRTGKIIIVETKGYFPREDRQKIECVIAQHPDRDFRIVFSNPNTRISKTSRTRYSDWCDHRGIKWAARLIPAEWFDE